MGGEGQAGCSAQAGGASEGVLLLTCDPLSPQTPERPRHTVQSEVLRSRASSPRRAGPMGDGRFHPPPRIHRASDPGLPGEAPGGPGVLLRECPAWQQHIEQPQAGPLAHGAQSWAGSQSCGVPLAPRWRGRECLPCLLPWGVPMHRGPGQREADPLPSVSCQRSGGQEPCATRPPQVVVMSGAGTNSLLMRQCALY